MNRDYPPDFNPGSFISIVAIAILMFFECEKAAAFWFATMVIIFLSTINDKLRIVLEKGNR